MPGEYQEFETDDEVNGGEPGASGSTPADRRVHLENLKALGGTFESMATDLLDAMDKREAAAAAQAAALAASEDVQPDDLATLMTQFEAIRMDPDADPIEVRLLQNRIEQVKDGLRAEVLIEREATDKRLLSETEALLRLPDKNGSTRGDESIALEMAELRAAMEATRQSPLLAAADPLEESQVWRTYQSQRGERERSVRLAKEMTAPTWEQEVAAAEAGMAETLAGVLNG